MSEERKVNLPFTKLNHFADVLRQSQKYRRDFWENRLSPKPTSEKIISLYREGWRVKLEKVLWAGGRCNDEEKVIRLREDLTGYRRDLTLFHEIAHAVFREQLEHNTNTDNFWITNWLAVK